MIMKMMQRSVAVADLELVGAGDRGGDICFRVPGRGLEIEAFCKACCNGRRERTAATMRIFCRYTHLGKASDTGGIDQKIDALGSFSVTTLNQNGLDAGTEQRTCLLLHFGFRICRRGLEQRCR